MLQFAYQDEPLQGPPPPSLSATATVRWRPLVPITVVGPAAKRRFFSRALLDSGADDTIFPLDVASLLGVVILSGSSHQIRWRGQGYPLRFGRAEFELSDGVLSCQWSAVVGFSPAPLRYPILGIQGCLQFFDVRFLGDNRVIVLEPNPSFVGKIS